ncbi:MAG: hypothetical protein RIQ52_164 [Pseudomonadota bacterium]
MSSQTESTESANTMPVPLHDDASGALLAKVLGYLDELDWRYSVKTLEEERHWRVTMRVVARVVLCRTIFDIDDVRQRFGVVAYAPFLVPEDRREAVMLYLTRANYRLYLAKFEFDFSDGEISTVCNVIHEDAEVSVQMIDRMRSSVHAAMRDFMPTSTTP